MAKVLKNKVSKVRKSSPKVKDLKVSKSNLFRADNFQREVLLKAGEQGAVKARRISKALGLEITYLEKGQLVKELVSGERKVLKVKKSVGKVKLKKGIILHAK